MPSQDFRNVLITGAEGALGTAVVRRFQSSGSYRVTGTRMPQHGSHGTPSASEINWVTADLSDPESVRSCVREIGTIHALVHCAGGFRYSPIDQISDADIQFLLDSNLRSSIY